MQQLPWGAWWLSLCCSSNAQVHTVTWADDSLAITDFLMASSPMRGLLQNNDLCHRNPRPPSLSPPLTSGKFSPFDLFLPPLPLSAGAVSSASASPQTGWCSFSLSHAQLPPAATGKENQVFISLSGSIPRKKLNKMNNHDKLLILLWQLYKYPWSNNYTNPKIRLKMKDPTESTSTSH